MLTPLDRDLAVHRDVEAAAPRYLAQITNRWNTLGGNPNGGYLAGICTQALSAEVPHPDPLVVSTFYVRPAKPGPAVIDVDQIRHGRRFSTARATLSQDGKQVVLVTATFADLKQFDGPTKVLCAPPSLPDPDECLDPLSAYKVPGVTITDRVGFRFPATPGWLTGSPTGQASTEFWMRFREGEATTLTLPLLVDAAAPAVLELGPTGSSTLELTTHVRAHPTGGWLACRVTTRHLVNGLHEEDFEIWDRSGGLVAQSRQLAFVPPTTA